MRDFNDKNQHNEKTDEEVFNEFKAQVKTLLEANGFELKYSLRNYLCLFYEGGVVEVYDYDRPRHPVLHEGVLSFTYSMFGVAKTFRIKLVKNKYQ